MYREEMAENTSMFRHRTLKAIHLAGTAWLVLCVGFVLVVALRQAGFRWWVIFSLSAHAIVIMFLLVSLYLFAILRGVSRTQKIEIEHPLTSTDYYIILYVAAPFLGGLAGCLGMIGVGKVVQFLIGVALGTFVTTLLVWVVVDPVTSMLESVLTPTSRRHRAERLAQVKAEKARKQKERQQLLEDILAKEETERQRWQQVLRPQAEKLAELLTTDATGFKGAGQQAIELGLSAWQLGGITCMRELRDMAITECQQRMQNKPVVDYISYWWDGIGSWRSPSLDQITAYSV
jgi:hypothetical protein